jgi:hypothetical protein
MGLGSGSADAGVSADADVLIIGAGFAGICMGMHLRCAGRPIAGRPRLSNSKQAVHSDHPVTEPGPTALQIRP